MKAPLRVPAAAIWLGALLGLVGTYRPWLDAELGGARVQRSGVDGDGGTLLLVLYALSLAVAIAATMGARRPGWAGILLGLGAAATSVYVHVALATMLKGPPGPQTTTWGFALCVVAALLVLGGSVAMLLAPRTRKF